MDLVNEKLNGYLSILSIKPKYTQTKYPYNQLGKSDIVFTEKIINILATEQKQFEQARKNKKKSKYKGGGKNNEPTDGEIIFYQ